MAGFTLELSIKKGKGPKTDAFFLNLNFNLESQKIKGKNNKNIKTA